MNRHNAAGIYTNRTPFDSQFGKVVPLPAPPAGPAADTPVILPAGGSYLGAVTVTITDTTSGAVIYYTTDGSTPTTSSTVYSGPFTVSGNNTVNAIAQASGGSSSSVASQAYTVLLVTTPTATAADTMGLNNFGPSGITSLTVNWTTTLAGFDWETDPNITSISFPNLVNIDPSNTQGGFLQVSGNTALTLLDLPVFVPNNGNTYTLSGNAFTAATVNAILHRFVLNAGFVTGTIDLSGGTNAAPTGQGATDKATLIGRGVTVTTN